MLPCFNKKIQEVEHIIKHAPCEEYDTIDRIGILQYRSCNHNTHLPELVTLGIQRHLLACQERLTRLKQPVFVFIPDSLKNIQVSTREGFRLQIFESSSAGEANRVLKKFNKSFSNYFFTILKF